MGEDRRLHPVAHAETTEGAAQIGLHGPFDEMEPGADLGVGEPGADQRHHVALAVGAGLSNAEIGRRLHLVEGTVKAYLSTAFGRLGVRNRVQAAVLAHEAGLVSED